ncbi:hypothetical protein F4821DRAFT_255087 [Hypoxylon rubiginosum]|uniref:Uncharacterized protein n=1 Tax=Hypoxylon rubiginosum TaxID=110542 RepID=A0ACC0DFP6_9PEZI|nr:hypothetical protein F4821DRAFT_255087 [Hypoxylon rubiginosum]
MPTTHHCPLASKGGCRKTKGHCVEHLIQCRQHEKWTIKGQDCPSCISEELAEARKQKAKKEKKRKEEQEEKDQKAWDDSYGKSKKSEKKGEKKSEKSKKN